MADLDLDIFDTVEASDIMALTAGEYVSDIVFALDSQAANIELVIDDSADSEDAIITSVDLVVTDVVKAADLLDFLRNILHLAQRIFTLRLMR